MKTAMSATTISARVLLTRLLLLYLWTRKKRRLEGGRTPSIKVVEGLWGEREAARRRPRPDVQGLDDPAVRRRKTEHRERRAHPDPQPADRQRRRDGHRQLPDRAPHQEQ